MLPVLRIFNHNISMYSLAILVGIAFGTLFAVYHFSKYHDIPKEDIFYAILFGIIGLGIGAKLLYIITNIPFLIQNASRLEFWPTVLALLQAGFVFYGGLIGGILGIYIYSKAFKVSFKKLLLIIVPVIPLVHAFGRIGCFFAGCCHGMEYHGFGSVVFTNSPFVKPELLNVPLFPSQIVESICNLIIFIILLVTYKKMKDSYKPIALYCILYSIVRFVLEFFRGDTVRGFLLNLSTSQWISILIFIVGIGILIYNNKHKENMQNT